MGRKNRLAVATATTVPSAPVRSSGDNLEKTLIKAVILFFAVVLIYIPSMFGGYIYDDDQLLTMNPIIQQGVGFSDPESWYGLGKFWFPVDPRGAADYFPVTSSVLWAEWRIFGNNEPRTPPEFRGIGAPGYHTVNIVLHALCAVLLWVVFDSLGIPGAWIAAFVWGIHPVCVESVAWISELKNTLSMFLFLLMMLTWLRFLKWERSWENAVATKPKNWAGFRQMVSKQKLFYGLTIALFIITLLAKTAIVMVPFVMLVHIWWEGRLEKKLDWNQVGYFSGVLGIFTLWIVYIVAFLWFLSKWSHYYLWEKAVILGFGFGAIALLPLVVRSLKWFHSRLILVLRQSVPFFMISFVFGMITWYFQVTRAIGQEYVPIQGIGRIASAFFALGFYLYKTFLPFNLVLIYPQWHVPTEAHGLPFWVQALPALFYAAVFYFAWKKRETWGRHVIYGLSFFILMLFPILGLVKIAYLRLTLVADHFEYTPMVGVIPLAVAWLLMVRQKLPASEKTFGRVIWTICFALLGVAVWYFSAVACSFFGVPLALSLKLSDLTLLHLLLVPIWAVAGYVLFKLYYKPLKSQPLKLFFDLACVMIICSFCLETWVRADIFHDKEKLWLDTLAKNPESWQAHSHYGAILFMRGDFDGALKHWKRCVELKPYLYEVHNNYGLALSAKGRMDEALLQYKTAVDIDGTQPAVRQNYADGLRMTKHYGEAVDQYRELLKIAPGNPNIYLNLGVTFFMMGRIDDAIGSFQDALKLAPNFVDAQRNLDYMLMKKRELQSGLKPENEAHVPHTGSNQNPLTVPQPR